MINRSRSYPLKGLSKSKLIRSKYLQTDDIFGIVSYNNGTRAMDSRAIGHNNISTLLETGMTFLKLDRTNLSFYRKAKGISLLNNA